jgi:FlgN protein
MPELRKEDLTPLKAQVQRMLAVQERILQALAHKREAIRTANSEALLAATESEGALVSEMVNLEQQRRHLVQEMTKRRGLAQLHPGATLAEIAALAKSGEAKELLDVGAELRRLVEQAAQENNVLREAGGRLLGHLQHLSSLMHGALDRAKTYSRAGRMQVTPQLSSTVDLRS